MYGGYGRVSGSGEVPQHGVWIVAACVVRRGDGDSARRLSA